MKISIKLCDYYICKICVGEIICFSAFISETKEDIEKHNFLTPMPINVNELSPNYIYAFLRIKYN